MDATGPRVASGARHTFHKGGQVVATTVIQIFNGAGLHAYLYNMSYIYIYYIYIYVYPQILCWVQLQTKYIANSEK